ncbi:hypothetical protein DZF93_00785 [Clavibacter michiganensis subsp. insidiosus]|uniref:Uncharacterized protein n=1 Tax=Clavibacter michiganensis subsp. insidiosus TaxID=33014 RepID=A0A399SLT8_9MICO|nr:hypothetical protein B5P21_15830 [Clavibacter michiganensis subsp. insidiosus]RIJ44986.1 hypothetical protein DZF93_00785 [Clavibacter michiganensis subsp. insidiosus]RMC83571.1 hypothetical protein CmiCFBP2404_14680 [Clavibacter michiganensis subsp. insidiosus]
MAPPVAVIHAVGPLWAVNGQVVAVGPGQDPRRSVLDAVARAISPPRPARVVITDGSRVTRVVLRPDGSSVAEGDDAHLWVGPSEAPAAPPQVAIVGVHPLSGATTWAQLLHLRETEFDQPLLPTERALLVCRSVPAGLAQVKYAIRDLGRDRVAAVLVVADAPGRPIAAAMREQKVVAGAAPAIRVPWVAALRGALQIPNPATGRLARVAARVNQAVTAVIYEEMDKN